MQMSRAPCTDPVCSDTTMRVAPKYCRYSQLSLNGGTTALMPSRTMKLENHWATMARPWASAFSLTSSLGGYQPATSVPAYPVAARSSNMTSMVFHSPTSGISSLRQAMGCMPQVMPWGSWMGVVVIAALL